jgi:predicted metal-dependent enzyme (double-stranded beta helix superfamily)
LPPTRGAQIDMTTIAVTDDHRQSWTDEAMRPLSKRKSSAVLEIETAVRAKTPDPHEAVSRILELRVTEPGLLDGLLCLGSPDRYTRHLIYAGPGFSILAVVWMPGQMSPIHAHRSWCALGIREGSLVETCFSMSRADATTPPSLTLDSCRELHPGTVSHSDGNEGHYHRIANLGVETAVSIHVYGVAFDLLGHGLNRVWDAEA